MLSGVGRRNRPASHHSIVTATMPTRIAVGQNPSLEISTAQSGVNSRPPTLDPLNAIASAAGRRRSNHGDTMAGMAAPLVAAQPTALDAAATKSCQGSEAIDQPIVPPARPSAPIRVISVRPKRRYRPGSRVMRPALITKWHVIAAEISDTDQPRS